MIEKSLKRFLYPLFSIYGVFTLIFPPPGLCLILSIEPTFD